VTLPFAESDPAEDDRTGGVRRFIVEADGGSRGNPGPAAYGALVRDADSGRLLQEDAKYLGHASNNVAEYKGMIAGVTKALQIAPDAELHVRMDSKLVVEQMSGRWKIKHEDMRRLALEARAILPRDQITYTWVPRAMNSAADRLANEAMDLAARGKEWVARPVAYPGDPDEESEQHEESGPEMSESTTTSGGSDRLAYRLLTGPDDQAFCERVSAALADGYQLHGNPAIAVNGDQVTVAQALVDPRVLGFGS
jgi:probable phosphoglycerate mutase